MTKKFVDAFKDGHNALSDHLSAEGTVTITNQCGTKMPLENFVHKDFYFTGTYYDAPIIGIKMPCHEFPETINLSHEGAKEALERVLEMMK